MVTRWPLRQVGHTVQEWVVSGHTKGAQMWQWSHDLLAMAPMGDCQFKLEDVAPSSGAGNSGYKTIGHVQKSL